MAKRPNLFMKHYYIRLTNDECNRFFELIKGTAIEDETFLKRRSTNGYVYVYRRASGMLRGEPYRDWKKVTGAIYTAR